MDRKIVCITYTNIAKDEIIERTEHNELIHVGTIHDFLWECIKKFQSELKVKFLELMEEKTCKRKRSPRQAYRKGRKRKRKVGIKDNKIQRSNRKLKFKDNKD